MDLWLPIVLSAAFVFVVSSVIHMALPMHKGDMKKLPGEERIVAAIRAENIPAGQYAHPCPTSMEDCKSPAFQERFVKGPVFTMVVRPSGPFSMGPALVQWFVLSLVMSLFAAYVGTLALAPGAEYGTVFRLTGTVAILGYAFSEVNHSIWKGVPWGTR
jgi:hypothetical protein